MKKNSNFFESLYHAFSGIGTLYKEERNMWIHTLAVIVVVVAGILLPLSVMEWVVLILCMVLVIAGEIINTIVERTMDKITTEYDIDVKKIKDMSSSFVLILSIGSAIIGVLIFLPKIIALF